MNNSINLTPSEAEKAYLDFFNHFLTYEGYASYYDEDVKEATALIDQGRSDHYRRFLDITTSDLAAERTKVQVLRDALAASDNVLYAALQRVELANSEGSMILSAWKDSAYAVRTESLEALATTEEK